MSGPQDAIQAFYEKYPLPDPTEALPDAVLAGQARPEGCPSWWSHVYWPRRAYRADLDILIAGCGTTQAAIYAAALPQARIVAVDVSARSLEHSTALCRKHGFAHVIHRHLPLEAVDDLKTAFDLIISTGVVHHTRSPEATLRALRGVLRQDGSISLMLYATYGRAGVYHVQEMLRRMGLDGANSTDADLDAIRTMVNALPAEHPMASQRGQMHVDIERRSTLADLFLNPRDRAYTVPEIYALLAGNGLALQRWLARSQYEPACQGLATNPLMARVARLPIAEQYAIGELLSTRIIRHRFVACRDDRPRDSYAVSLDGPGWRALVPVKNRGLLIDATNVPPGRSQWLSLPHHRQDGIRLNLGPGEIDLFNRIDGERTIAAIESAVTLPATPGDDDPSHSFWRKLYAYDLVDFRAVV